MKRNIKVMTREVTKQKKGTFVTLSNLVQITRSIVDRIGFDQSYFRLLKWKMSASSCNTSVSTLCFRLAVKQLFPPLINLKKPFAMDAPSVWTHLTLVSSALLSHVKLYWRGAGQTENILSRGGFRGTAASLSSAFLFVFSQAILSHTPRHFPCFLHSVI